jgi:hypothetical protein
MDRIEQYIQDKVAAQGRKWDRHYIKVLSFRLMILLFADDIVLLSYTREGMQHLLQQLQSFCDENQLEVNI